MPVSPLMALGAQAMHANYAALQTTGNNIANAHTAGYSRQQVELSTAMAQGSPSGFFGRGVDVTTVTRLHNQFLTREAAASRSAAASDAALNRQLQQLERVFQTGEMGIGHAVGELFNAFADVAAKPMDLSARQVALGRIDETAGRFRTAQTQLDTLQSGINQELKTSVAAANGLTRQIADLNQQISLARGSGHAPNDLLDLRDSTLSKLSELLQINTVAADDGSVNVFLAGGMNLVLGTQTVALTTVADPFDPAKLQLGIRQGNAELEVPANMLGGGSISGLMLFQNRDLVDAQNRLGQLAAGVADQLNRQQGLGIDLNGQPGGALLQVGAAQVLPANNNSGNASIALTVADSSQLRASDYELVRDSAASYSLRRLSDNHVFSPPELPALTPGVLSAGFRVDGITIQLAGAAEPANGDRFLIRPLAAAARDIALAMDHPRGIAAASPVSASTAAANTGTMGIDRLTVLTPIAAPVADVVLRFDRDPVTQATTYTWSTDGGATFSPTPETLLPGQPIVFPVGAADPQWRLSLRGTPAIGDSVRIQPTALAANNNGNANALLGLRDLGMIGADVDNQSGGVRSAASSFGDAWANLLADFGVRVQTVKAVAKQSAAVAEAAQTQAANNSGVNLDEEAARMIQFQQSYQAAAKMLQVAQAVFDSLLQAASR
ncbi:flagellar hook-associated protein FlgK [Piscinibacter sakaiensis]|uniref:flagellar hook-associated protein FlgK n=1 Tax=Piscinibacter sakaiensis TaxID=1547922 RepID=UPI003AAAC827